MPQLTRRSFLKWLGFGAGEVAGVAPRFSASEQIDFTLNKLKKEARRDEVHIDMANPDYWFEHDGKWVLNIENLPNFNPQENALVNTEQEPVYYDFWGVREMLGSDQIHLIGRSKLLQVENLGIGQTEYRTEGTDFVGIPLKGNFTLDFGLLDVSMYDPVFDRPVIRGIQVYPNGDVPSNVTISQARFTDIPWLNYRTDTGCPALLPAVIAAEGSHLHILGVDVSPGNDTRVVSNTESWRNDLEEQFAEGSVKYCSGILSIGHKYNGTHLPETMDDIQDLVAPERTLDLEIIGGLYRTPWDAVVCEGANMDIDLFGTEIDQIGGFGAEDYWLSDLVVHNNLPLPLRGAGFGGVRLFHSQVTVDRSRIRANKGMIVDAATDSNDNEVNESSLYNRVMEILHNNTPINESDWAALVERAAQVDVRICESRIAGYIYAINGRGAFYRIAGDSMIASEITHETSTVLLNPDEDDENYRTMSYLYGNSIVERREGVNLSFTVPELEVVGIDSVELLSGITSVDQILANFGDGHIYVYDVQQEYQQDPHLLYEVRPDVDSLRNFLSNFDRNGVYRMRLVLERDGVKLKIGGDDLVGVSELVFNCT